MVDKKFHERAFCLQETFSHGFAAPIILLVVLETFIEKNRR